MHYNCKYSDDVTICDFKNWQLFFYKLEAVHPQSPWVISLSGLCKQNEDNLQRKRGRKKALYLLKYLFAPDKTFRFVLSMHKSCQKNITTYPGALGVLSFTLTECSLLSEKKSSCQILYCPTRENLVYTTRSHLLGL